MHFLIITHVLHTKQSNTFFAYAPYVREMNLWLKYVDEVSVVAPLSFGEKQTIDSAYLHNNLQFVSIPLIAFTSIKNTITSLFKLPVILFKLFKACQKADHIHLRCPGNMGLLGCLVQVFFPKKAKTAKYAGNWAPNAKQPLSYRFQKWILANTFLTQNIQVLVYGNWKHQSKNIKPFFTATFTNEERQGILQRDYKNALQFVFVGSLVEGKRPLLAIEIVRALKNRGMNVVLDVYGDGVLRSDLKVYIEKNNLQDTIKLYGNQEKVVVKSKLQQAHFLILPSKSEGWPKAVAEAMFFGTIPIATSVSCVPDMLDYGNRGILIEPDLDKALHAISDALKNETALRNMSEAASKWSQKYTLDIFEDEISNMLKRA